MNLLFRRLCTASVVVGIVLYLVATQVILRESNVASMPLEIPQPQVELNTAVRQQQQHSLSRDDDSSPSSKHKDRKLQAREDLNRSMSEVRIGKLTKFLLCCFVFVSSFVGGFSLSLQLDSITWKLPTNGKR